MPLIKLSQGFSKIVGKSNGSVFAENATGKYFRNNSSLVGLKSKRFSQAGNRISHLASLWRTIPFEAMEAWKLFASNNPGTNKLGDPYKMSGFNKYISVNSLRVNAGREFIIYPPENSTIPNSSEVTVSSPSEKQIFNQQKMSFIDKDFTGKSLKITHSHDPIVLSLGEPYSELIFTDVCSLPGDDLVDGFRDYCFPDFVMKMDDGSEIKATVREEVNGNLKFQLDYTVGGTIAGTNSISIPSNSFNGNPFVGLIMVNDTSPVFHFIYSTTGDFITLDGLSEPVDFPEIISSRAEFIPNKDGIINKFRNILVYQDFSLEDISSSALHSYILPGFKYIIDSSQIKEQSNSFISDQGFGFDVDLNSSGDFNPNGLIPAEPPRKLVTLEQIPASPLGGIVRVRSTPPQSAGKNGANANKSTVLDFVINGDSKADISAEYEKLKKYAPNNSVVRFSTSGISDNYSAIEDTDGDDHKKVKFKAGSELAKSVN